MIHLDGAAFTVARIQEPHKPSSTGRVYITPLVGGTWREFFPSVIGAKWIGRTDGWIETDQQGA